MEDIIDKINNSDFITELLKSSEIFLVGGMVRDLILSKESKDIDLLIKGLGIEDIISIISKFGKVDITGKSFNVIKFKSNEFEELIDITIPRKEEKIKGMDGHKAFKIISHPDISISEDLERRDFTINSMGINIATREIVDPFNGLDDIKLKQIRMTNPKAFSEDPLRMLRAIQFASRFNFNIENNTFESIIRNKNKIKEISPERILIEFDKIFFKGNHKTGRKLLMDSGILEEILGSRPSGKNLLDRFKNRGDFFFSLLFNDNVPPSIIFDKVLNGDKKTKRWIKALEIMHNRKSNNILDIRLIISNMVKLNSDSINTELSIFSPVFHRELVNAKNNIFPKLIKDLDISGDFLSTIGTKKEDIGKILFIIFKEVLSNRINNNSNDIKNFILDLSK